MIAAEVSGQFKDVRLCTLHLLVRLVDDKSKIAVLGRLGGSVATGDALVSLPSDASRVQLWLAKQSLLLSNRPEHDVSDDNLRQLHGEAMVAIADWLDFRLRAGS